MFQYVIYKIRKFFSFHLESGKVDFSPKHIDVTYYEGDRKFIIRFPRKRGAGNIVCVTDSSGKNITSDIIKYAGPCENFHGIETTPGLLGYEEITIETIYGDKLTFDKNSKIQT